ncbi:MAG: hypothetical protein QW197_03495 [Candidatus Aenigmatarchaeota archaeon]
MPEETKNKQISAEDLLKEITNIKNAISEFLNYQKEQLNKQLEKHEQHMQQVHIFDLIDNCPHCKAKLTEFIKSNLPKEQKEEPKKQEKITKKVLGSKLIYKHE